MIKKYSFIDNTTVEFDDSKTVRELLNQVFEVAGYYEPFGMGIVTLYQPHSTKSTEGWFTTDVDRSCSDEIENEDWLCIAYHKPGVFYFAEGGWGHHMISLGNHPHIENPVLLHLRFDDFDNSVVVAGKYTFADIINELRDKEYIPMNSSHLVIRAVNPYSNPRVIHFSDPIMRVTLDKFKASLPNAVVFIDIA